MKSNLTAHGVVKRISGNDMNHDELMAKFKDLKPESRVCKALRAVVELHKCELRGHSFTDDGRYGVTIYMCIKCNVPYPCEDIQAIEKELA